MNTKFNYFPAVLIFLLYSVNISADDWNVVLDLKGYWKFNIGNDQLWADYNYNDEDWDEIWVPSSWEDEGYYNYNGYAWYRHRFQFSKNIENKIIYLSLGYIDDVDEVYLNGKLVGTTGSFPPNYGTAFNANRRYPVPIEYFYRDKPNVIAVKVYDSRLTGGIMSGEISLMVMESMNFELNLEGFWRFKTGDDPDYKKPDFDDSKWGNIIVPSKWEVGGYPGYDGFAWYRTKIQIPGSLVGEKLVIILGRIDDIDECYINGQKIGGTGDFITIPETNNFNQEWLELRGYYIPDNLIKFNAENSIAVRVYDGYLDGGIYQGPIGIATQEEYRSYWKEKKRKKGFWEYIFD